MSSLTVYHQSSPKLPNKLLNDWTDIASTLASVGVGFERVQVSVPVKAGASEDEVFAVCRQQLDTLMSRKGYEAIEVVSLGGKQAMESLRARLLEEHNHGEDELRWFIAGRGLVSLHIEEHVYALLCERNDVLSIPAGVRHWLDLGQDPRAVFIRLFQTTAGMQAVFTGDPVSSNFPRLDD